MPTCWLHTGNNKSEFINGLLEINHKTSKLQAHSVIVPNGKH